MNIEFRISRPLLQHIHTDLSRVHPFAAERVGFIACASGALAGGGLVLLGESYHPVADSHYVNDPNAGATIGSAAIRIALQIAYNQPVSMFHVHRHEHLGLPRFSRIDLRESRRFVPDFFKVRPERCHGVIVLSHDALSGLCWLPGKTEPSPISRLAVVGRPTSLVGTWA